MPFNATNAWDLLAHLAAVGQRPPGTRAHAQTVDWMQGLLTGLGLSVQRQRWWVPLSRAPTGRAQLTNLLCRIPGREPGPPTLVGTHWDSRWIADNDPDPAQRGQPIPGINDGGSGTVVQLELARALLEHPPRHNVILAFFDGEDLGGIDGHPFAVGSRYFVAHMERWRPDEAIVLDMVGGAGARYNIETNSLSADPRSRALFSQLFIAGRRAGHPQFSGGNIRTIYSDHGPLLEAGVPAALLIDIDYPWWHTQDDTLTHCDPAALGAVGGVLFTHLRGAPQ